LHCCQTALPLKSVTSKNRKRKTDYQSLEEKMISAGTSTTIQVLKWLQTVFTVYPCEMQSVQNLDCRQSANKETPHIHDETPLSHNEHLMERQDNQHRSVEMSWSTISGGHANTDEPEMGRPRLRFKDSVKSNLKKLGIDRSSWQWKTKDRAAWRDLIRPK
uniref:Uncharacterized protein n=1 Tax=Amphiprion ocellaris TaxID=80972 RepID=A0AAQ5YSG1_AMPOC